MAATNVVSGAPVATELTEKLGTAQLLFQSALALGLQPSWVTKGGVFAITANGREHYVNFARSPLNTHTSISLARNKAITRKILARHDLPNIPFAVPESRSEAIAFLHRHGKIIAKPIGGSGAEDVHIVTSASQILTLEITKYILEEYIAGQELRYLVLNGEVIGVHRSDYGTSVQADRALERISYEPAKWDPSLSAMANKAAKALDLRFAAVDYLIDDSGRTYILEVNSTPGLKWFHAPSSGPVIDVAGKFLSAIFTDEAKTN